MKFHDATLPFYVDPEDRFILRTDGDPPPDPSGGGGGDGGAGGDPPLDPAAKAAAEAAAAAAAAAEPKPPVKPDWRDRELDAKHRKIKAQEAELAETKAENERLRGLAEAATKKKPAAGDPPPVDPSARAEPPARPVAPAIDPVAKARFDLQVEALTDSIRENYAADWEVAHSNIDKLGGLDEATLNGILATDDPAYVLVTLGKNPERFQELMAMPPAKRHTAMVKIGMEKAAPTSDGVKPPVKKPSNAPAPPNPVQGTQPVQSGPVDLYEEKDDAKWFAERERQKAESRGRPWSRGGKAGPGATA